MRKIFHANYEISKGIQRNCEISIFRTFSIFCAYPIKIFQRNYKKFQCNCEISKDESNALSNNY